MAQYSLFVLKVPLHNKPNRSLTKGPIDEVKEFTYLGSVVSTTGALDSIG